MLLAHSLVFVTGLVVAAFAPQSGVPRFVLGQWIITDEGPQDEAPGMWSMELDYPDWPNSPPPLPALVELTPEFEAWSAAPLEPYIVEEQDMEEWSVWLLVLVVFAVLLMATGAVGMSYYLCVWRGGRIHYRPQRDFLYKS